MHASLGKPGFARVVRSFQVYAPTTPIPVTVRRPMYARPLLSAALSS